MSPAGTMGGHCSEPPFTVQWLPSGTSAPGDRLHGALGSCVTAGTSLSDGLSCIEDNS